MDMVIPCQANVYLFKGGDLVANVFERKVYMLWYNMKRRCLNENNPDYKYYGAKGVKVCEDWMCFSTFKNDITNIKGFDYDLFINGKLVLDKDTKKGNGKLYSLGTCEFVSKSESNKRIFSRKQQFKAISPDGKIYFSNSIKDFSDEHGLHSSTVGDCLRGRAKKHRGWIFEKQ